MDFLSIGSVVTLDGSVTKVMIVGIAQIERGSNNTIRDYIGVRYPVGIMGEQSFVLFDSNEIVDVIHYGYKNKEHEEFVKVINEVIKNMKQEETFNDNITTNDSAFE